MASLTILPQLFETFIVEVLYNFTYYREMKFLAITFLTFAIAVAGPISVSDNNVGDIVSVGVRANLEISNQVEQNIVSVIVALLNQGVINFPEGGPQAPNL